MTCLPLPTRISRVGGILALAALLFAGPAVSLAQFDSGESQPPPHPKPRFPQLPDDEVDVPPVAPPAADAPDITENKELVGYLQKVEDRKITFKHNKTNTTHTVGVSPRAEILLNTEPVALEKLRAGDFVRVILTQIDPDPITNRVVAARVVEDTPPQERPVPRPRPRVPERVSPRQADSPAGLGVTVHDSPDLGILVLEVHRDTPASKSGLRIGDYLLQMDQKPLDAPADFLNELARHKPNEKVRLTIWRNGKKKEGLVTLATQEVARDRVAADERGLVRSETNGNQQNTVVTETEQGVFVEQNEGDRTIVEQAPGNNVAIDRESPTPTALPKDYDKLAEEYRRLQERVSALEEELNRLKRQ